MCTHVNHGMESDDPAVAAMYLAYAATFDPSVYVRCAPATSRLPALGHHVFHGAQAAARAATSEFCGPPPHGSAPRCGSPGVGSWRAGAAAPARAGCCLSRP
eukprot:jgi/Tetstr1/438382/TSEL_026948.t1